MNIDQFRAIKAEGTPEVKTSDPVTPEVKNVVTPTEPEQNKITIDGVEVTIEELKNGYFRQSDYTKKTQELARKNEENNEAVILFEYLRSNPQLAKKLEEEGTKIPNTLDPSKKQIADLENKIFDMMLESDINKLSSKYKDFDVAKVLNIAKEKGLTDLEDAYFISKKDGTPNVPVGNDALTRAQLKAELLKEIEMEVNGTRSIISTNNGSVEVKDDTPKLSEAEKRVARNMKMPEAEYVKWRDAGRRK